MQHGSEASPWQQVKRSLDPPPPQSLMTTDAGSCIYLNNRQRSSKRAESRSGRVVPELDTFKEASLIWTNRKSHHCCHDTGAGVEGKVRGVNLKRPESISVHMDGRRRRQVGVPVVVGRYPLTTHLSGRGEGQQPQVLQLVQKVLLCDDTSTLALDRRTPAGGGGTEDTAVPVVRRSLF